MNALLNMNNKRIFISGGAGVIGSEMIPFLLKGNNTLMVGDLKPRPKNFDPKVIYRQGDLNYISFDEIKYFEPEIIIHLAATFERSEESYNFWEENFSHNVKLSHHLLTIAKQITSLKRYIFASSYLIYDPNLYQFKKIQNFGQNLNERDFVSPRNLTGMAKLSHEMELDFINKYRSKNFTSVCARIFRGYGRGSRDIISRWIRSLLKNEVINVYNSEGIFDYIYAKDSAIGLIKLANNKKINGVINLGTGKSRSVNDIIQILKVHFPLMKIKNLKSKLSYEASQANMELYKNKVGWIPHYNLEKAIPEIIKFEKKQLNSKNVNDKILNILITSSSNKIPLIDAAKDAANKISTNNILTVGDISNKITSKYFADKYWKMPEISQANVLNIINGCLKRKINLILPTRDSDVLFFSKNYKLFLKSNIQIICSPYQSIKICFDKYKFSLFGKKHKLNFITSDKTTNSKIKKFVVKERYGSGSKKIGLNLNRKEAEIFSKSLDNPIFQPYIKGREISIDSWLSKSNKLKGLVFRNRSLIINGESRITETFEDKINEKQLIKIIEKLKLSGPINLQAIIDKNKKIHIIECNPRFGGASTASIKLGLDMLGWSFAEFLNYNLNNYRFNRFYKKISQVRIIKDRFF